MVKNNVYKLLALTAVVLCVGCAGTSSRNAGTGAQESDIYGTGNASSGAGTGSGATDPVSGGTGDASSGAGTGSGGTTK